MQQITQLTKILNLLFDNRWHCTSEMYGLYIADVRRRLCDLQEKGYTLESKKCELHDYHKGRSKMWKMPYKYPTFRNLPYLSNSPYE